MSTNHTPEPWHVETGLGQHIVASDGEPVVFFGWEAFPENYEANRSHIVACVNALAGRNPEAIDDVVEALLAGVENEIPTSEWIRMAFAALTKLETTR